MEGKRSWGAGVEMEIYTPFAQNSILSCALYHCLFTHLELTMAEDFYLNKQCNGLMLMKRINAG